MRFPPWWVCGLVGGVVLSLATAVKVIRAFSHGAEGEGGLVEALGFAAAIFGMGFVCGLVVWAGQVLSRRYGLVGDAVVGMAVMLVFFAACMLLFAPEMFGEKLWYGGLPMAGLGAVVGLIGGAWVGRDLRKWIAEQEDERRRGGDGHEAKSH